MAVTELYNQVLVRFIGTKFTVTWTGMLRPINRHATKPTRGNVIRFALRNLRLKDSESLTEG